VFEPARARRGDFRRHLKLSKVDRFELFESSAHWQPIRVPTSARPSWCSPCSKGERDVD
jgi:hypothetical protein